MHTIRSFSSEHLSLLVSKLSWKHLRGDVLKLSISHIVKVHAGTSKVWQSIILLNESLVLESNLVEITWFWAWKELLWSLGLGTSYQILGIPLSLIILLISLISSLNSKLWVIEILLLLIIVTHVLVWRCTHELTTWAIHVKIWPSSSIYAVVSILGNYCAHRRSIVWKSHHVTWLGRSSLY